MLKSKSPVVPSGLDIPTGWATLAVAIGTFVLAGIAVWNGEETKKLAEISEKEIEALRQQNQILKDQFELSIKPALMIYPASSDRNSGDVFDIVMKNVGRGIAKGFVFSMIRAPNLPSARIQFQTLDPGREVRQPASCTFGATTVWKVSVTGMKDILDRPQPDIIDFEVRWPPAPLPPPPTRSSTPTQ